MRVWGMVLGALLYPGVTLAQWAPLLVWTDGPQGAANVVTVGAQKDGVVDPYVTVYVALRYFASPVVNWPVTLDFSDCSDIELCTAQPHHSPTVYPAPAVGWHCENRTVTVLTSADGNAVFRIAGGATNNGSNSAGHTSPCARVLWPETVSGTPVDRGAETVAAPDENWSGGINPADLSAFQSDQYGSYRARSDLNGGGTINNADAGLMLAYKNSGNATQTCQTNPCEEMPPGPQSRTPMSMSTWGRVKVIYQ